MPILKLRDHEAERIKKEMGRVYTGLSQQEGDALRMWGTKQKALDSQFVMPMEAAERVRLFYEKVAGKPVPPEILAQTARQEDIPEHTTAAGLLAAKYAIDLRLTHGSGPRGTIVIKDVQLRLRDIAAHAVKETKSLDAPSFEEDPDEIV